LLEATPEYVYGGEPLIRALRSLLGDVRVIVALREPCSRVRSFFLDKKAHLHLAPDLSFEDYLIASAAVPAAERLHRRHSAYMAVEGSLYDRYLPQWLGEFGEAMRVVFFEDLVDDSHAVLAGLAVWLGIDPGRFADVAPRNRTVRLRSAALHRLAGRVADRVAGSPRSYRMLRSLYYRLNGARPVDPIRPDTAGRLARLFEPHNAGLALALRSHGYRYLPPWLSSAADQVTARGAAT
jgi:hypothetical protein